MHRQLSLCSRMADLGESAELCAFCASQGGALADKGSVSTLRTASGGYMRVDIGTASNGTSSVGRRLLQDGAAGLTISRAAAAQACTYLSEGAPLNVLQPCMSAVIAPCTAQPA